MLSCVKRLQDQQKLLTKHRRNRKLVKDLLMEADKLSEPDPDSRICQLRLESVDKRIKKALEILERCENV